MKPLPVRLYFIAMLFFANNLFAQVDTSTTQKLLQYIFQNVDKSQVSTGFLEEYGCPIIPIQTFNGTLTDSNRIDMNLWRTLYFQLQTSYCQTGTNPLPAITTANATIKQNATSNAPIPIPLLIGQYNKVREDAFSSNLLSYNTGTNQIYDVTGRNQNPYQLNALFAACPNKKQTITGSERFICKSDLIWNNTGKSVTQIQIDFANGQGFQNIALGNSVSVSYTDTGYKRWTVRVSLSDNSVLQCYSDYYVLRAANTAARYGNNPIEIPAWGFINVNSGAVVSIAYSNKSHTGTLRKPLIVVEGYDVSTVAPNLQFNYGIGDFIQAISTEPGNAYDFNGQLDDVAGYDIVFVDFNDGADDIVRNSAIVEEVIRQVNLHKVNDDRYGNIRQQNVVMGLSMGGLCARYGLAHMTKNGETTETRLLITHDSPHRGANVPLGLQYLIRMMGGVQLFGYNVYDIYPSYDDAIGLLNAPATQQLLLYRSVTANTFAANTFLDGAYRSMITFSPTDPQPGYRFIATSLGSECAHSLFQPYTQLLNVNADGFFFYFPLVSYRLHTIVEGYALPSSGSSKIAHLKLASKFKLFGLITVSKDVYDNTSYAPGSQLAVDGAPGATNPLTDFNVPQLNFGLPLPGIFGIVGYISVHVNGTPTKFTFVPVGSALDVNPYNANTFTEKYVNGVNQNYPSSSATFIAQESITSQSFYNNAHLRFTARNSKWLFNEMENLNNFENCSSECSNPYYIAGPGQFCSSATYSIPGLQRGATVAWSVNSSYYASISCSSCNPMTLSRANDGTVILTATLSNTCGGQPITISKTIQVGSAAPSGYYNSYGSVYPLIDEISGTNYVVANQWTVAYITSPVSPAQWAPVGGYNYSWYVYNNQLYVNVGTGGYAAFDMSINGECGTITKTYIFEDGSGYNYYSMSPNPATSDVTISVKENQASQLKNENSDHSIHQIIIRDKLGNAVIKRSFPDKTRKATVNVSSLSTGFYLIQIFDGKNWSSLKLMKN